MATPTIRKFPIGIQSFEKIRKENFLYVDKTALVYQLAVGGNPCFLSRPRRFGKSLLISTPEAYFEGRRELFEGLAVYKLETERYATDSSISCSLSIHLDRWSFN